MSTISESEIVEMRLERERDLTRKVERLERAMSILLDAALTAPCFADFYNTYLALTEGSDSAKS